MSSYEHRFGTCNVVANARLRGDQPIQVRGVTSVASPTAEQHIAVRVNGVLFYLEDRAALEAFTRALRKAQALADDVFGPEH